MESALILFGVLIVILAVIFFLDHRQRIPMFVDLTSRDGELVQVNVTQIRDVTVRKDGFVRVTHGTGNGFVEIPEKEYIEVLKPLMSSMRIRNAN